MKELTIEEKAARYDEAIKRVENIKNGKCETTFMFTEGLFEYVFPELKESEDAKIRKVISDILLIDNDEIREFLDANNVLMQDIDAWLKKQGEKGTNGNDREIPNSEQEQVKDTFPSFDEAQGTPVVENQDEHKSAWSKEDEKILKGIIDDIQSHLEDYPIEQLAEIYFKEISWLKSIEDRVQPKQEWSEEDESIALGIEQIVNCASLLNIAPDKLDKVRDWLKSLKERYTWKPSDEQMDALYTYIYNPQYFSSPDPRMELVESVYQELKKLK